MIGLKVNQDLGVDMTKEELNALAQESADEQREAQQRAERNESICGTVNCSTEYACHTSGY